MNTIISPSDLTLVVGLAVDSGRVPKPSRVFPAKSPLGFRQFPAPLLNSEHLSLAPFVENMRIKGSNEGAR